MASTKRDPVDIARDFMAMSPADARTFWATIQREWNDEESDIEAVWFYTGQMMGARELAVISAIHSALASGNKSARK